jgi:hypothetical protein
LWVFSLLSFCERGPIDLLCCVTILNPCCNHSSCTLTNALLYMGILFTSFAVQFQSFWPNELAHNCYSNYNFTYYTFIYLFIHIHLFIYTNRRPSEPSKEGKKWTNPKKWTKNGQKMNNPFFSKKWTHESIFWVHF